MLKFVILIGGHTALNQTQSVVIYDGEHAKSPIHQLCLFKFLLTCQKHEEAVGPICLHNNAHFKPHSWESKNSHISVTSENSDLPVPSVQSSF